MSEVKEHLLGDEHELEFEDAPSGNDTKVTTNFFKSPSLARYMAIAAYSWAALCTIPALIFFIRLANHVCACDPLLQILMLTIDMASHILMPA